MKKFFMLPLLLAGLIFSLAYANTMEDQKMGEKNQEMAEITKALNMYRDAAIKGDSKVAQPAFAPLATMSYAENGRLVTVPIKELFNYYDKTGPHVASYEVVSSEIAGDVAVVSIDSKFGDAKFDDMFTLVKDGNAWKIVSKVYHVK